jgi:probable rRNA maturation factor
VRSLYGGPWRVDIDRRPGVPKLVPDAVLARLVGRSLSASGSPRPASVAVTLTGDVELASLNATHMGQDGPTDVLSFPILPPEAFPSRAGRLHGARRAAASAFPLPPRGRQPLGDIVVSVERAIAQSEEGRGGQTGDVRWSPADELRLLVVHGALHLCGWDHAEPEEEAAMRALERQLLGAGSGN